MRNVGLVDLVTFNFMNLAHGEIRNSGLNDEDVFYVNLGRDSISVAISQKQNLMFFRSRALEHQRTIGNLHLKRSIQRCFITLIS